MSDSDSGWLAGFKADYQTLFVEEWSPFVGAMLLVLTVIGLMLSGLVWGVFGGVKFWGDWFNNLIGLGPMLGIPQQSEGFLMHRMSLMNIMLVVGALSAALLSRQFSPNRPPPLEYLWAAAGGSLLGIGAALAGGCTTGGFFNPVLHSSPAGWAMWLGCWPSPRSASSCCCGPSTISSGACRRRRRWTFPRECATTSPGSALPSSSASCSGPRSGTAPATKSWWRAP